MKLYELDDLIKASAPIDGINSDGVIWFKAEATSVERDAAQALMDAQMPNVSEVLTRVEAIDAEILALEKQAIEQGLIRTIIDDLLIRSLAIAAAGGVTEAQLLDPQSEHYSRAYQKVHANAVERALLRAQR